MDQTIEGDVRQALTADAERIPAEVAARLCAIDYRPRSGRLSPGLTVGALGGVAATVGTVVSVIVLGSAQPAFAGWTAAPAPASGAQTASADTTCQSQVAASPALSGIATGTGWNVVTTDVRGPFTVEILQDGTADATCFTGPSLMVVSASSGTSAATSVTQRGGEAGPAGGSSSNSFMLGRTASGDIGHMSVAHLDSSSDGAYTLVEGQLDPSVLDVALVRSDGSDVQASTGGGWFVAWWPGNLDVTSAEITTASGVTDQPIITQPLPSPDGGSSAACSQGGPPAPSPSVCTGGGSGAIGGPPLPTQGG